MDMKKILLLLSLLVINAISVNAKINYTTNKYGVMMVYFVCDNDSLSTEQFRLDWAEAISIAESDKKVKQVQLKDNKGEIIGWADKSNIKSLNKTLEKIISEFSQFDEYETIYGDSVLETEIIPEKYNVDTYRNGVKESSYSSDWNSGYFPPETSTYTSGGVTYKTRKYYTSKRTISKWVRPVKEHKLTRSGALYRLSQIYKMSM